MANKNEKKISVKIEGKEWEKALDDAFVKANKKAKIDGFRPGHAPKDVFIKRYGVESLFMDAAESCMHEAYHKMMDENKNLEIVAQPQVDLKNVSKEEVEFEFILTLKPTVKLGKYKNLNVKRESTKVTKEEVDKAIKEMQNRFAENTIKNGAIENGDIAIIDFEGFKDGVAFDGGKGENYSLTIGSNTFIPGFEEQLIGMKKGEEKEIKVTFPENYHSEELKGQDATFKVSVNEVKQIVIPEIDEDFFKDLGMEGIDTKEKLENQVKENIKAEKERTSENKYIDALLDKAMENMEVDLPQAMIDEELHRMLHQYEDNLKMQGITLEQFYQYTNSDEESLKAQMSEEAIKRIKSRLLLEEVANQEKIKITKSEADKEASELAKKYQMKKEEFLSAFGGIEMVQYDMQMRKAIEVLKENK
ncbi:MAG: trigger factor [Bacilli bacterium]|nr:trigger factor [Bacilli bacterium]